MKTKKTLFQSVGMVELLDKSKIKRYHIEADTVTNSLNFYEYFGDVFTVWDSVLINTVDLASVSVDVDDVAINGSVLTFKDVQSDQTLHLIQPF